MADYYDRIIKKYTDQHVSADPERLELFKRMGPLTKDLLISTYGSFDKFMSSHDIPHPLEEYYISFDENMFEDNLVAAIGRRMGIHMVTQRDAYKVFIDRVMQIVKESDFTYDDYVKYINMTEKEYDKLGLDYHYDDRLFVFMFQKRGS